MSVAARLAAGTGLVLALLLGVLVYQGLQVRRLARTSQDLARSGLAASRLALQELYDLNALEDAVRKARVTSDPDYLESAGRFASAAAKRSADLDGLLKDPEARQEVARLSELLRPIVQETPGMLADVDDATYLARLRAARDQAGEVLQAADRTMTRKAEEAHAAMNRALLLSLLVSGLAMGISVVVLLRTARSIQRPLNRLAAATRAVAQGRFDERLEPRGRDEFARVSEDFNVMVQRLGDLDQMKKDILSHVSHELKAPLAGMRETSLLMLEEIPGPLAPEQRRLLELNVESAKRLTGMIAKMLDLARLDAGAAACDLRAMDLSPLLRSASAAAEPMARERGVLLRLDLPGGEMGVLGDEDRLFQVVSNLLENALKFSPRGGEVVLSASRRHEFPAEAPAWALGAIQKASVPRGWFCVSVADEGPGVPEGEKIRIFERFHQVRGSGHTGDGGVGLGLAICRDIVMAHGGALWVSDRPNGGSEFTVCLGESAVPGGRLS